MADLPPSVPADMPKRFGKLSFGLSGQLLALTALFVMLAEVMIYVPSVANFRVNWLNDRLAAAHTAALVLEASPSGSVPESLAREILHSVGAHAVVMKMGTQRKLLAAADIPEAPAKNVDMRELVWYRAILDAFWTLFANQGDSMRVIGSAPMDGDFIEVIIDAMPLQQAMWRFSVNILILSLAISGITATLVYIALHRMLVRPMRRITANMIAFRAAPENADRIVRPSGRADEVGLAENELASMQRDIASMLQQKSRLAALGLAVSKISHDLRNLLASAQLISDELSNLPDPRVQRFAPKLMRALERAIGFCQSTLSYGAAPEAIPERSTVSLEPLLAEVHDALGLGLNVPIRWIVSVDKGLTIDADREQLFRVLVNLGRNSVQALEAHGAHDPARDQIRIVGRREGREALIEFSDTGPGIPERARAHLFEAFQGSTRPGGTGLGLAIAAELLRAHGGEIRLVAGTIGATFHIRIPDREIDLNARSGARARA